MPGFQELLVIALIVAIIFFLPRMTSPDRRRPAPPRRRRVLPRVTLSGRIRLALVGSVFWAVAWALIDTPWQSDWRPFVFHGVLPVAMIWAMIWVIRGFNRRENRP